MRENKSIQILDECQSSAKIAETRMEAPLRVEL